jgi:hypothetical protein
MDHTNTTTATIPAAKTLDIYGTLVKLGKRIEGNRLTSLTGALLSSSLPLLVHTYTSLRTLHLIIWQHLDLTLLQHLTSSLEDVSLIYQLLVDDTARYHEKDETHHDKDRIITIPFLYHLRRLTIRSVDNHKTWIHGDYCWKFVLPAPLPSL